MGLFSGIKKALKKVIKVALPVAAGAFGLDIQPLAKPARVPAPTFPGLPALPPGLAAPTGLAPFQAPRLTRSRGQVAARPLVQGGGCPVGFHPAKDGSGRCVRNRRMNVLNHRAAMRAIRRIKGARKMLMKIERQLPKPRGRPRQVVHRRRLIHEDS